MSTWNGIYLRAEVPADVRPALEGELPVRAVGGWREIALPGVESGDAIARELSSMVRGEVVWILIQTTASVLAIVHYEGGKPVRRIEFADGQWRRVEGAPRAWESGLFSAAALEDALEAHGDEDDVRSAFAKRTLTAGEHLPWPREWDAMWSALGVTSKEWMAARDTDPVRVLIGTATSRVTIGARVALVGGASSLAAGLVTTGDARALLVALGVPLLLVGLGAAALRRATLGRWLF